MSSFGASRLFSGTMSLGLASVVALGLGFVTTMYSARHFPASVWGAYILVQVVVIFLTQISTLGLQQAVPRLLAADEDEAYRRDLVGTALVLRLGLTLVTILVAWQSTPLLSLLFGQSLLPSLVPFVPILFVLESTRGLFRSILQGFFRFSSMAISDIAVTVVNLILLVGLGMWTGAGATNLVLARVFAVIVGCVIAYVAVPVAKTLVLRRDLARLALAFGLPLQGNDILHFIFTRVDTLLIGALLGSADIALYEVARRVPDSLRSVYQSYGSVYYVYFAKLVAQRQIGDARTLLNASARLIGFGVLLGAVVAALWGREIIEIAFSARYAASSNTFVILVASLSVALVGNILGTSLLAAGDSVRPTFANVAHTVVSLIANALLIPSYGILGAAVASAVGNLAVYPLLIGFLRHRGLVVDHGSYLRPWLAFGIWLMPVLIWRPTTMYQASAYLALFLVFCAATGTVTPSDMALSLRITGIAPWLKRVRLLSRSVDP